jgi:4-hydroxybenzoate polyprenyltransferase
VLFSAFPVSRQLLAGARASEWWGYKFAPLLATAYATVALSGGPLLPLVPRLLGLLLAFTVGAVYVSLINDWTDRADDQAGAKVNRLAQVPGRWLAGAVALTVGVGVAFGWYFWRVSPLAGLLYLGAWVAYSLYSVPPLRLKARGIWGLLADATGAHVFPQLLTVVLLSNWAGAAPAPAWLAAVGVWALGSGLRNILWHQLGDAGPDAQAGVNTFVVRHGLANSRRLATGSLVVEVAGLGALLYLGHQPWAWLALAIYGLLVIMRVRVWRLPIVIAQPRSGQPILLNEYYESYYPLALLVGQVLRYPTEAGVLLVHMTLFGWHSWQQLRIWGLAWAVVQGKIRRVVHATGE